MKSLYICACLALTGCAEETSTQTQAASTKAPGHMCQQPPQQALDACANLTAGAACSFDADGHHIDGTCRNGPDGQGPLACAPQMRLPPPEAIDACASSTAGAACAFTVDGHDVTGTCKAGPDGSGPLACAPDQPPPPPPGA
jgi:hypothetical protein